MIFFSNKTTTQTGNFRSSLVNQIPDETRPNIASLLRCISRKSYVIGSLQRKLDAQQAEMLELQANFHDVQLELDAQRAEKLDLQMNNTTLQLTLLKLLDTWDDMKVNFPDVCNHEEVLHNACCNKSEATPIGHQNVPQMTGSTRGDNPDATVLPAAPSPTTSMAPGARPVQFNQPGQSIQVQTSSDHTNVQTGPSI